MKIIVVIVVSIIMFIIFSVEEGKEYKEKYMSAAFTKEMSDLIKQYLNRKDCYLNRIYINTTEIYMHMYPYDKEGYVIEKESRYDYEDIFESKTVTIAYKDLGYEDIETHFYEFAHVLNRSIPGEFNIKVDGNHATFTRTKRIPIRPKQKLKSVL